MDIRELKNSIENKMHDAGNVIIVPHNNADFDAIASAMVVFP